MKFLEKIQVIERVDKLIRMKATGSPDALAEKLNVSRRCVYDIIDVMKRMDAPIEYDSRRKSFYYSYKCDLMIGFVDSNKVRGGNNVRGGNIIFKENIPSADFLHNYDSYLSISKNY